MTWRRALLEAVLVTVIGIAVGVALLSSLGCAEREPWRPFEIQGVVIDKALGPGDAYVVFIGVGDHTIRGEVDVAFYLRVERGDCVVVKGDERGGELRNLELHVPCGKPPAKKEGTST
jgi:hypothetical protein